jgi:hypothetical protein
VDWGFISGVMAENIRENGKNKNSMVLVYINGLTVKFMLESIIWTRKRDMEYIRCRTDAFMKDGGLMESSMGWALSFLRIPKQIK